MDWAGLKNFTTGMVCVCVGGGWWRFFGSTFVGGGQYPITYQAQFNILNVLHFNFHLALDANKQKKKGTVRQKKSKPWKCESDGESDDAASGKENKKPLPGKGKRKHNVRTRKTVLLNQVFSSDDEDIFG